jgi:GTP cyclohydrolase I
MDYGIVTLKFKTITYNKIETQNTMIKEMKSYEKIEQYDTEITERADNYKVIIENRRRRKPRRLTEERVAKAMQYLTHGYA